MPKACKAPPDMLLAVTGCSNAAHRSKAATLATRPSTPCRPQKDLVLGSVLNGPCDRCWPITLFDRHADGTRSERRSFAAVSGVRSAGLATSAIDLNKRLWPQKALAVTQILHSLFCANATPGKISNAPTKWGHPSGSFSTPHDTTAPHKGPRYKTMLTRLAPSNCWPQA